MWWMIPVAIVVIFVAVLLIRTLRFTPPPQQEAEISPVTLNEEKIIADMADMIRCKTVSNRDASLVDWDEFTKFQDLLAERFPRIHEACTLTKLGKTGLLYHLKGKSDAAPSVCMSHYDVVPVEEEGWEKPAFDNILPALFGGLGVVYISKNVKLAIAPLVFMIVLFFFVPSLASSVGVLVPVGVLIALGAGRILYKKGKV